MAKKRRRHKPGLQRCSNCGAFQLVKEMEYRVCMACLGLLAVMKVSARAWGGGVSTIYMMDEELVRRGWITHAQFALDFGLARLVPGINLLAMAVIFGYRLNGPLGSIVAPVGLMVPASAI